MQVSTASRSSASAPVEPPSTIIGGTLLGAETIAVAELPNRRDALAKMEERLRVVNQGTAQPESTMIFEAFVDWQWKVLPLPNFKASTQIAPGHARSG